MGPGLLQGAPQGRCGRAIGRTIAQRCCGAKSGETGYPQDVAVDIVRLTTRYGFPPRPAPYLRPWHDHGTLVGRGGAAPHARRRRPGRRAASVALPGGPGRPRPPRRSPPWRPGEGPAAAAARGGGLDRPRRPGRAEGRACSTSAERRAAGRGAARPAADPPRRAGPRGLAGRGQAGPAEPRFVLNLPAFLDPRAASTLEGYAEACALAVRALDCLGGAKATPAAAGLRRPRRAAGRARPRL